MGDLTQGSQIILFKVASVESKGISRRMKQESTSQVAFESALSSRPSADSIGALSYSPLYSVWRPLLEKIEDAPLALCDPNSVEAEDLLEVDRVTEHWVGEVYYVKHNPNQRWYWLRHMKADEVCIFTSFDSHPSPAAMNCESSP